MAATRTEADELSRLQAVQARVRTLARNHVWFRDAIRAAFDDYSALVERFAGEELAMRDRERRLARELLEHGRLFDPKSRENSPCRFVRVRGLCPVGLAGRLGTQGHRDTIPRKLEREGAAAALAALDRDVIYQDRGLPEKKREAMAAEYGATLAAKTHVSFVWTIAVSRPAGWQEPADPRSLDRADLERFGEADYRTIALHRLGGLADVGALRPIVPEPKDTGDIVRDVRALTAWRSRLPIDDDHREQNHPPLSVQALPPDVAEQLLDDVETWAKGGATPPTPCVYGEPIDEHDVALLVFLNRTPSLRRRVSDVLPDKGPQDRKTVAKRLRKLADRTPALVDYPKNGRSGVAILPAGTEALKQTTAPTPR